MMRLAVRLLPLLAVGLALSESTTTTDDTLLSLANSVSTTIDDTSVPTGSYLTYSSTIYLTTHGTVVGSSVVTGTETAAANSTNSTNTGKTTVTTTSESVTVLVGGHTTITGNATANVTHTAPPTSSSSAVVNTQPCNGYAELCTRKYSNITMVAAHNSPFVMRGNVAANQALGVEYQLEDGIRMLQFQTHYLNGTMYLCHTSCDLLNAGTLEAYLTTVATWMRSHPYDVVTILIGNYDYVNPENFTAPIESSGLMDMVYTPPMIPMGLDDWPTLSNLILSGKRALVFMDYQANQTAIPWLMDEFSQMWETPFSPTNRTFPCTVQRPPDLARKDALDRMYMANHNLNLQVDIASIDLLIPNTALLNETNADSGFGSLGWMADNCTTMWNRPPNFLLVDYYNEGNFNGSVFEVAAEMNNVTYNRDSCCGTLSAASGLSPGQTLMGAMLVFATVQFLTAVF